MPRVWRIDVKWRNLLISLVLLVGCGCHAASGVWPAAKSAATTPIQQPASHVAPRASGSPLLDQLVAAARDRLNHPVRYDPTYFVIPYPNGDVPEGVGVCTDEVIRSYRKLGIDLQKEVHEDIKRNFQLYPSKWGLTKPDPNIDHRRVPNLQIFFERQGESLPITTSAKDYNPGDMVTWDLGGGATHIGIVVDVASTVDPERLMIMHNIGAGPQLEDVLFNWKITGHYRYFGNEKAKG